LFGAEGTAAVWGKLSGYLNDLISSSSGMSVLAAMQHNTPFNLNQSLPITEHAKG